ncbi:type I DNA topoisomerase [Taibaiella chishuiensis]|uniref:DNA topoisomerase 1 n=1 Tax=Taibaiella chishuiensis TaxID=1434707 RepID=A0A2P8D5V0_9BACT|nr:type I DNA topoisomerase [Taibaiella chishuiensis]PSK92596.1 DNA topoisomerase I [Taibaiella chishuiensis]
MAKNLLIVESPAKAKTIEKILGKDFEVKSSFGHIRDLDKEGMGIDIEHGFTPRYSVSDDKKKVVAELRAKAKAANEVWLATDEDREGEAISWHLCEVLGLNPAQTKRIVFHEITKPAIQAAVTNPRLVDMNLVNAQQARRVLDRLVGFEISPVLWRKLSGGSSLSAGRVQSVAVRLIVEREREINQFKATSDYRTEATFEANDINGRKVNFKAEGARFADNKTARTFLEKCVQASFKVEDVQVKPGKRSPAAPFTTSTLQQEASRKLGMSVSRTMRVAQTLYENGHITYMRTDSVNLSVTALENAAEVIRRQFGEPYYQRRQFQNKNQSAQEAHEAIRPTDMAVSNIGDVDGQRLYELIWKRTLASQMADAQLEKTVARIGISTVNDKLTATGEVLKFEGFLKVYIESKDDEDEDENTGMLPPLVAGQALPLVELKTTERFSRPAPRYTEASLVKKLEELGIGRPSTYAPTISTVQQRNYVERKDREGVQRNFQVLRLRNNEITEVQSTENTGAEKGKLFPTDLGMVVTDFLNEHFTQIMDYGFTANIENEFDQIAAGKKVWNNMIGNFYEPFHKTVEETMENAERVKGERVLGPDPESGKPVVARLGRFGPMVQIGSAEDEDKPRFATIKSTQSIETITLEEALDLFKLPFTLGDFEDKEVSVGAGRFGPYVKWGEQFISIPRTEDPLTVDMDRALELIREKQEADAPIGYYDGKPVSKGKGRFGPFIKWEDLFINIPRAYDFDNLKQSDVDELVSKKLEKEANRFIQQWPEEKIAIENGRWGPFIRFGKQMLKLGRRADGEKYTAEDLAGIGLEEVKQMIVAIDPTAFEKKTKKAAAKKAPAKKGVALKKTATVKKAASKKAAPKKEAAKKK